MQPESFDRINQIKERIKRLAESKRLETVNQIEAEVIDDDSIEENDQAYEPQSDSQSHMLSLKDKLPSDSEMSSEEQKIQIHQQEDSDMIDELNQLHCEENKADLEDKIKEEKLWNESHQRILEFAQYLEKYEERRRRKYIDGAMDLGVRHIHEVVFECVKNGILLPDQLKCLKNRSIAKEIDFVKKFSENDLKNFDFENHKFTPLDHRRLCDMLILKNPEGYTFGQCIYLLFRDITEFCIQIYKMEQNDYQMLCKSIDQTYRRNFSFTTTPNKKQEEKVDEQVVENSEMMVNTSEFFRLQPSPFVSNQFDSYFPKAKEKPAKKKVSLKEKYKKKDKKQEAAEEEQEQDDFSFNEENKDKKKKPNLKKNMEDEDEESFGNQYYSAISNNIFMDNSLSSEISNLKKQYEQQIKGKKEKKQKNPQLNLSFSGSENSQEKNIFFDDDSDELLLDDSESQFVEKKIEKKKKVIQGD